MKLDELYRRKARSLMSSQRGGGVTPTDWLLEFAGEKEEGFKLPIFFADVI